MSVESLPSGTPEPNELICLHQLPADRHPVAVYLAGLAPGSRRTMQQALGVVATLISGGRADVRTLAWEALRYQHCQAIRSQLTARYAAATVNKTLAALKAVLRECWRLGLVSAEHYHRSADLKGVTSSTLPRGRALSPGELRALFRACADGSKAGVRDAALLATCYAGGLRRSEAVRLDLADYESATGSLSVRAGKGRRDRVVYASNGAADALRDWITLRGTETGPLFRPINKAGRIIPRRMTDQAVFGIVRKRGAQAEIAQFSPHDLRRTFVSDLLDAGGDISIVRRLAGHSSETTTARYDRRGETAKAKAAQLLHVPYVGRDIR